MKTPKIIFLLIFMAFGLTVNAQQEALHARAEPFQGTWGVRILHATAYDEFHDDIDNTGVNAENFDVNAFMAQIDQLTTISHVMINLNRGHQASWYSSPYPAMEAVMGSNFFPTRDLLSELIDAIRARNLKVLVYYSRLGFDNQYVSDADNIAAGASYSGAWSNWTSYANSQGITTQRASANIIEYYSLKFGTKIDGWWVDRCTNLTTAERTYFAEACRAGNPNAIVTLQTDIYGSPMGQPTAESDYTAGHPIPMNSQPPWTTTGNANGLEMVKDIEAGPWINMNEQPDPSEGTALGSIFMPFQRYWRNKGSDPTTIDFPIELSTEWTLRTIEADGMYIWAVERVGSGFASVQFGQLVDINTAVDENGGGGPGGNTNLALNGTATQSTTLNGGVASRAIDDNTAGNFGSGSVTAAQGPNAWWEVDLGGSYNIGNINIFNRTDGCCSSRLSDFTVSVINSSGNTIYTQTITSVPNPSTSIDAGGALGKVIRIQSNTTATLNLAEVQVFEAENTKLDQTITFPSIPTKQVGDADFDPATASSGYDISYTSSNTAVATIVNGSIRIIGVGTSTITASQAGDVNYNPAPDVTQLLTVTTGGSGNTNIALSGTATQSTTLSGGVASRAIDGNTAGNFGSGSVTAAQGPNAWWEVDLGGTYSIDDINIFNRTDGCCVNRLSDFTVSVINSGATTFSQTITTAPTPSETVDAGGAVGDVVRIQSNLTSTLNLAEVEVFGTASSGGGGTFVPDPNKTYYIDCPVWNLRLAASGSSEDAYTTSTTTTGNDVEWKFVDKGNGYWHLDRAAGGTKPRLRTDGTANADMNQTAANGANTYYEFSEGNSSGTYFLTLPDGAANFNRLQIDNSGAVKMTGTSTTGSSVSFTITDTSTGAKFVDNKKSVDDEQISGFNIYPNPVLDILTINIDESKAAKVDIINNVGQILFSKNIKERSTSIDLGHIASGIYILKVSDEKQTLTKKIIKK